MKGGVVQRLDATIADRLGSTALQLGTGTSLHEHDWRPDKVKGSFRNIGLKRKHSLSKQTMVELGGGWTAFHGPKGRYGAAKLSAGLVLKR